MVIDVFNWITIALYNEFGADYKYYVEDIEQNVNKPCFVVGSLNPIVTARSPVKYRRVFPIVLHYFTNKKNTEEANKDCYQIAERLWDKLEYLQSNEDSSIILRGEEISWELVEGVLQFFITYVVDVIRENETTPMEEGYYNGNPIP